MPSLIDPAPATPNRNTMTRAEFVAATAAYLKWMGTAAAQMDAAFSGLGSGISSAGFFWLQSRLVGDPSTLAPATGQTWLVPEGATGDWAGQDGAIALYTPTGWIFAAPTEQQGAWVFDAFEAIVFDGEEWRAVSVNRRIFVSQIVGVALAANEVLFTLMPPPGEAWTFAGNLAGSAGRKLPGGTNPAATYTIALTKNGIAAGSIVISDAGVVTGMTIDGDPIVLDGASGDVLQATGPATPDAAAVGYVITLLATYT